MFSLMTALVSPRVVETLEGRKDILFQTLQERAGVLCVQPSHGVCMLQGEWECMKKAHLVLEELCLQVQAQKSFLHNGRSAGAMSKEDLQKMFALTSGGQSGSDNPLKIYEEMQQRQWAHWTAQMHFAQQMATQMLESQQQQQTPNRSGSSSDRPRSANPAEQQSSVPQPPREDTPLNLKKDLDPPLLDKYGGSQTGDDAESYRGEEDGGDNALTIDMMDDEASQNGGGSSPKRGGSSSNADDTGSKPNNHSIDRPTSRSSVNSDIKPPHELNGGGALPSFLDGPKAGSALSAQKAMVAALGGKGPLRDNAKYADPQAGMTAEGMISAQLMASGLPPYGPQFRAAPNSPAPEDVMRGPFISQDYRRLAAVELALLERRMQDSQAKVLGNVQDSGDDVKDRYTPDRIKPYTTTPIMPAKEPRRGPKDLAAWPPRPPSLQMAGSQPENMDSEDYEEQYFKCSACFAGFSNTDALQEHMMTAHAVGPGLTADKTSNLIINTTADAYCCPVCGKFYKSSQRLREHIPLHDKNYQRPTYPCPACSKTFTYRHNMKVHYQKIHKGHEPPKRHQCTICGQKFHKPVYLRNHLLRHKEVPDPNALDYTMAPSPRTLAPTVVPPTGGPGSAPPAPGGGTESVGGEDTSASGSPGTTTSE